MLKPKCEIALSFRQETASYFGYRALTTTISVLRNEAKPNESPKWRNCSDFYDSLPEYSHLVCTSHSRQGDNYDSYGHSVWYQQIYKLEAKRALLCAKTLNRIDKSMDAMNEKEGFCTSFGAYVNRFARAIGAEKLIVWAGKSSNYDDDEHQTWKLKNIPYFVDTKIRAFMHPENEGDE